MKPFRGLFLSLSLVANAGAFAQFTVFAAETVAGSVGGNTAAYGGVQQYNFTGNGSAATPGAGIAASQLSDAISPVFHNGQLFVGNRHGNTLGQGSIKRFDWNGVVASNGTTVVTAASAADQGFHGFAFAPNGDVFVNTVNNGTRRFRDPGTGFADIGGTSAAQARGALVSADGTKLYETIVGNDSIRVTEILANGFGASSNFNVAGASAMHQLVMRNGKIMVTGFNSSTVHEVTLDASGMPTSSAIVANVPAALGIPFSPDGQEMFISGHTTNNLTRLTQSGNTWQSNGTIATGTNMGYLATAAVPEPGSFAVLGLGAAALIRRRRKA